MRKYLIVALLPLVAISLVSCNNNNSYSSNVPHSKLEQIYINTSDNFTSYSSNYKLIDGDDIVYETSNEFKIQRGDSIRTSLSTSTSRLNPNFSIAYPNKYNIENTSYVTIGETQYYTDNYGITTEKSYVIPEQFLSFTFEDKYLENVTETSDGFKGNVKQDSLSNFFNESSFTNVKDFAFELKVENDHFTSFTFSYIDFGDNLSLEAKAVYNFSYDNIVIDYSAN